MSSTCKERIFLHFNFNKLNSFQSSILSIQSINDEPFSRCSMNPWLNHWRTPLLCLLGEVGHLFQEPGGDTSVTFDLSGLFPGQVCIHARTHEEKNQCVLRYTTFETLVKLLRHMEGVFTFRLFSLKLVGACLPRTEDFPTVRGERQRAAVPLRSLPGTAGTRDSFPAEETVREVERSPQWRRAWRSRDLPVVLR